MNAPQTAETMHDKAAEPTETRLPWKAPVLGVHEAARLTMGSGGAAADGFGSTHS